MLLNPAWLIDPELHTMTLMRSRLVKSLAIQLSVGGRRMALVSLPVPGNFLHHHSPYPPSRLQRRKISAILSDLRLRETLGSGDSRPLLVVVAGRAQNHHPVPIRAPPFAQNRPRL